MCGTCYQRCDHDVSTELSHKFNRPGLGSSGVIEEEHSIHISCNHQVPLPHHTGWTVQPCLGRKGEDVCVGVWVSVVCVCGGGDLIGRKMHNMYTSTLNWIMTEP